MFLSQPYINAQFNPLDFERLSPTQGIPSTPISGIVQDKKGYIWIGTPTGIFRYNGSTSKAYIFDGSLASPPENQIRQIEYIDNKVIGLTPGGIFIHNCLTEHDTTLLLSGLPGVPQDLVNSMTDACSDGKGGLVLLSRSSFLHVDSLFRKQYEYTYRVSNESFSISSSFGKVLIPMPDGKFVIGGNFGLFVFNPGLNTTEQLEMGTYPVLDPFIQDRSMNAFELSPFEYLISSRLQNSIVYYHARYGNTFSVQVDKEKMSLFRWNTQMQSMNDSLHYLLMPGKGTMILNLDKNKKTINFKDYQATGLLPITLFLDAHHRLWLGSHNGLYKQRHLENALRKSSPVFDAELPEKTHVQFAISGSYLVTGTAEGLEMKFYDKTTLALVKQVKLTPPNHTLTSNILHFATYGEDSVLICTNGPRIWLNTKTWQSIAVDPWVPTPAKYAWYAFHSSIKGKLYTIHNSSTLECYDPATRSFVKVELNRDLGMEVRTPTQLAEDWNGDLWLSHKGFCRYRQSMAQIDFCRDSFPGTRLDRTGIGSIVMDSIYKMLWFKIQGNGIIRYDPGTNQYIQFTTKDGLPDLEISQMILVDRHLWLITPSGLGSISIDDYTIRQYPYGFGAHLHHTRKALTYDPENDQLYFIHENEIMACRPGALLNNSGRTMMLIEKIECGDSVWHWPEQPLIEIRGKERKLSIQLSYVSYEDTAPLQISYRFANTSDTTWRMVGNDGVTYIENLRPGKHDIHFRLLSTGNDIDPMTKSIRIRVYPLLWETTLFRGILALLGFVVMWIFIRWQFQRKKRKLQLDRRVTALELEALRSRMNPHFIFNCLNSINRYILKEDKAKASYFLSQFAKLIRYTLDYTSEQDVSLSEEINITRLYVELESLRMAEPIQLDVHFDPGIEPDNIRVPPLFIQPYVENAIWHGLASKKENLQLHIRGKKLPNGFTFEIEDNGVGRAAASGSKRTGQHISKGLIIAKETLEHYAQVHHLKTKIEIVDLLDSGNKPRGTNVRLKFETKA